jgi:hypothetical protein
MGLSQSHKTFNFVQFLRFLISKRSVIKFFLKYSSVRLTENWKNLRLVILFRDKEHISRAGKSLIIDTSSNSLLQTSSFDIF